ncbi:hypothetical protein ABT093_24075 [Kitasatospora sp. NPDC002551]|uniref:hypothetical protein n=1 Tax=Kitasatospora sp. NPDC002551 TaxID=3154539 RepID=UPI00332CACE3
MLRRTSLLLAEPGNEAIAVPGDVQRLVDAVYADDFGEGLEAAARRELERMDAERMASAAAEGQLAEWTTVCAPFDVRGDLSVLSERPVAEELLTTRLGADSGRAVCVYVHAGGEPTLDADGKIPLPGRGGEVLRREDIERIVRHTVPVPGRWLQGRDAEHEVPRSWRKRPVLADLVLLPMRQDGQGRWRCRLGGRELEISEVGLSEI